MNDKNDLKQQIFDAIATLIEETDIKLHDDTPLIGNGRVLNSMKLIELCLSLEDIAETLNFEFDWTSDTALSKSRSMYRTAGSLVTEFLTQMEAQK